MVFLIFLLHFKCCLILAWSSTLFYAILMLFNSYISHINRRLSSIAYRPVLILLSFPLLLWAFWVYLLHTPSCWPRSACVQESWVNLGEQSTVSICTVVDPWSLSRQCFIRCSVCSVVFQPLIKLFYQQLWLLRGTTVIDKNFKCCNISWYIFMFNFWIIIESGGLLFADNGA